MAGSWPPDDWGNDPTIHRHRSFSKGLWFEPDRSSLSGYSPRSVASWSKGVKATAPARRKFTELVRLFDVLADLMEDPKQVGEWLQEPNPAFYGSTPLQVIERGETDRLWKMIYALESGEPG